MYVIVTERNFVVWSSMSFDTHVVQLTISSDESFQERLMS